MPRSGSHEQNHLTGARPRLTVIVAADQAFLVQIRAQGPAKSMHRAIRLR
jgi:hypothetical protein